MAALHDVDDGDGVHRALDRDTACLALALTRVPVAEAQEGALDVDTEVAGDASPHLRSIHVAAPVAGGE